MRGLARFILVVLALASAAAARANYHTWSIDQVYSNADGSVQYVVLRETQGANGENLLQGRVLTVTRPGIARSYTFDHDLPSIATAGKRVLIATQGFAALHLLQPDYVVPDRFFPTDGAVIDYAGVDTAAYAPLVVDGASAVYRGGAIAPNRATNFAGASAAVEPAPVTAVEFYNAALDHYFVSDLAPDIDALDSGRIAGWSRTGQSFRVLPAATAGLLQVSPVCRFLIPPQHGNSHFFSASPAECATVLQRSATDPNYSGYVLETAAAFYAALPDAASGACPAGTIPVYRLWNQRIDSNHRYTTDRATKAMMVARGYVAEGDGPDAVAMCAAPPQGSTIAHISGNSPFAPGCERESGGTLYLNSEVEPRVESDPRDPNHLVAVWQQDRWSNGAARGNVTGVSLDGGKTWSRSMAAFTRCSGGSAAVGTDFARASDPWITFTPDGVALQIAIALTGAAFAANSSNAVLVSRSTDGGFTWSTPTALIRDGRSAFNDKETITADPVRAGYAYAVWDRLAATGNGPSMFARSVDSGATWEPARGIYDPGGDNSQTLNNTIVVLPDGTLVDFFTQLDFDANGNAAGARQMLVRSTDRGDTWSGPIVIGPALSVGVSDEDAGTDVRVGVQTASYAVGRDGRLVMVAPDSRFSGGARDAILFTQSLDGGLTWSTPVRISAVPDAPAFVPTVRIRDDGVIGVTYFDLRSDAGSATTLLADHWLVESADGASWRETHVAGPFDLARAPFAGGWFLGDYMGLASVGSRFVPVFAQTTADAGNPTDIFAAAAAPSSIKSARDHDGGAFAATPAPAIDVTPAWRERVSRSIVEGLRARRAGSIPPR